MSLQTGRKASLHEHGGSRLVFIFWKPTFGTFNPVEEREDGDLDLQTAINHIIINTEPVKVKQGKNEFEISLW